MKSRKVLLSFAVFFLLLGTAFAAASNDAIAARQAKISRLKEMPVVQKLVSARAAAPSMLAVGQGIAVSPEDQNDFKIVKLGIGRLRLAVDGAEETTAIGVLYADDTSYRLYNIQVTEGTLSGEIYNKDKEYIGKFSVAKTIKNLPLNKAQEVWVGTYQGSEGKTYYLYLNGKLVSRQAALIRTAARVRDFCKNNPTDDKCKAIAKGVANYCINQEGDARCRLLALDIFARCKNSPENEVCQKIKGATSAYCREHLDDERCLWAAKRFHQFCAQNPSNEWCTDSTATICDNNSEDAICKQAVTSAEDVLEEPVETLEDTVTPEGEAPIEEAEE